MNHLDENGNIVFNQRNNLRRCPGLHCERREHCLRYNTTREESEFFYEDSACIIKVDGQHVHGWKPKHVVIEDRFIKDERYK